MRSSICLIRHGLTEGNLRRLYYGASDIPLSGKGEEELIKLAAAGTYPAAEMADFYTTGMIRTEQTLKLIYGEQEHQVMPLLREIDFGMFEMKSYDEMKDDPVYQKWISDKSGTLPPPGGESIRQFTARVREGYEELKKRHALKVLSMRHSGMEAWSVVICHGGPVSAVLETVFPGEKDNFYQWIPDPGHGYILRMEDLDVVSAEKF